MSSPAWNSPLSTAGGRPEQPPAWAGCAGPEGIERPLGWYAVYTRARHEKIVTRKLERRGITVLLPLYRLLRYWRDRRKQIELPLFPSYVFVQAPLSRRLRILSAPGCVYLLSDSRGPVEIPPSQIDSVRILVAAGGAMPHPFLRNGRRVRVVRGPLTGVEGVLQNERRPAGVVVSIRALASSIRAEVPLENLEAI